MTRKGAALVSHILDRLMSVEAHEPQLWYHADIRLAWLTVNYAWKNYPDPFACGWQQVFGLHSSKGIPALLERERRLLAELQPETYYPHNT